MDAVANETKLSRCRTIRVTNGGGEGEGARGKKRENEVFERADRARNGDGRFSSARTPVIVYAESRAGIAGTGRYDRPGTWNADQTYRPIRFCVARIIMRAERNGSNVRTGYARSRHAPGFIPIGIRGGFTTWRKRENQRERGERRGTRTARPSALPKSERAPLRVPVARFRRSRARHSNPLVRFRRKERKGERGKERNRCASIVLRGVEEQSQASRRINGCGCK